jgi:hypothetical protein
MRIVAPVLLLGLTLGFDAAPAKRGAHNGGPTNDASRRLPRLQVSARALRRGSTQDWH